MLLTAYHGLSKKRQGEEKPEVSNRNVVNIYLLKQRRIKKSQVQIVKVVHSNET